MLKVARHFLTLTFLLAVTLLTADSCQLLQPTAHFFIINESQDRKAVDISVTLGGQTVFNDTIKYTNVRPDLQYTPDQTLSKGKYIIIVIADNGKVQVRQPIMLDGDRFIFITYSYKAPVDSTTLIRNLGFPFADKLKGQKPKIEIHIIDKEPVHL